MARDTLVYNMKSEIKGTAKALISIGLLSIPVFLYSLPSPGYPAVTLLPGIMTIALASGALGAAVKSVYFIFRQKYPDRRCPIKNAGGFFPFYLFFCNTIFTLILYALFCNTFLHLAAILSKSGLSGLASTVLIGGLPALTLGLTADKLRHGAVKLADVILKTENKN
jgi:hypothetical protein